MVEAAPGHVEAVRQHVFDALTPTQVGQLHQICDALLTALDPHAQMSSLFDAGR